MEFSVLIEKYRDFILEDPFLATNMGVHNYDHLLPKIDNIYFLEKTKKAKKLIEEINKVDVNKLKFNDKLDLDLMKLDLSKIIFCNELKYNGLYDFEQKPNLGVYIVDSFRYLFLKDPRDSKLRLELINSRFSLMSNFIDKYKLVLKKVVKQYKVIEVEELNEINELFDNILDWASKEKFSNLEDLKKNIDLTNKAIFNYLTYLNSLEEIDNFSIGKEKSQELINLNGIDLTLDEIFNISKDFFKKHNLEIINLSNKIKKKYCLDSNLTSLEVVNFIKDKYSIPIQDVISEYKKNQKELLSFFDKFDLFVLPKSDKLIILETPKYLYPSIPVGAMFPPAPFENGPKTSVIYLTIDEGRKKDQNKLMIKNTMIHEGIPGHHLQFAVGYENDSVVRKLANYNTHAEGWTTYLEEFMTSTNFIDKDILNDYNLIAKYDFARLGARVAIDLYFMSNDVKYLNVIDGFVPLESVDVMDIAKSLLQKATGFTDARAKGEVSWYSKERGYPMCYLIGNKLVNELQKDVVDKFKDKREGVKQFHKIYLTEGIMPISFLKKIFENKKIL